MVKVVGGQFSPNGMPLSLQWATCGMPVMCGCWTAMCIVIVLCLFVGGSVHWREDVYWKVSSQASADTFFTFPETMGKQPPLTIQCCECDTTLVYLWPCRIFDWKGFKSHWTTMALLTITKLCQCQLPAVDWIYWHGIGGKSTYVLKNRLLCICNPVIFCLGLKRKKFGSCWLSVEVMGR
jgi:hypothetical protein